MFASFLMFIPSTLLSLYPPVHLMDGVCNKPHKLIKQKDIELVSPCVSAILEHNQNFYLAPGRYRLLYRYEGKSPAMEGRLYPVAPSRYKASPQRHADSAPAHHSKDSRTITDQDKIKTALVKINQSSKTVTSSTTVSTTESRSAMVRPVNEWQFSNKGDNAEEVYLWVKKQICKKNDINFALTLVFKTAQRTYFGCGHILSN